MNDKQEKEKVKKWEPKNKIDFIVQYHDEHKGTGLNQASDAALIKCFNRLLTYRMEFAPDYEPDWDDKDEKKYFVYFQNEVRVWFIDYYKTCQYPCHIYFPEDVAEELVRKLNSGEVEL